MERLTRPAPEVIYQGDLDQQFIIVPEKAAEIMTRLGIKEEAIAGSAIIVSGNCLFSLGRTFPGPLAKWRYILSPQEQLRNPNGAVARVSAKQLGQPRTLDQINQTLAHELTHIKQIEEHPHATTTALLAVLSASAIAGAAAWKFTKNTNPFSKALAVAGSVLGMHQVSSKLVFAHLEHEANTAAAANSVEAVCCSDAEILYQPAAA